VETDEPVPESKKQRVDGPAPADEPSLGDDDGAAAAGHVVDSTTGEDEVDDLENADDDAAETKTWTQLVNKLIKDNSLTTTPIDVAMVQPDEPDPPLVRSPLLDETAMIHDGQKKEAEELMARIAKAMDKSNKPIDSFNRFEILIQNPNLISLYNQNVSRLESLILNYQKEMNPRFLDQYTSTTADGDFENERRTVNTVQGMVNTNHKSSKKSETVRDQWIQKIDANPNTLFLVIHDEAHYEATKGGGADLFINHPATRKNPNVVTLFVSATPYNLVTADSQVPESNIHKWKYDGSADGSGCMKYFGLK
jgi:hypothetical protein